MSRELMKTVDLVPISTQRILQRKVEVANIAKQLFKKADFKNNISGHFGVIPGTKQDTLLKPGAELLCMAFQIAPRYETELTELSGAHREYATVCSLYQIGTDIFLGQGVGSCSTMESKYLFRYERGEGENTGKALPGKYWGEKKKETEEGNKAMLNIIGGTDFFPKKLDDGRWMIFKKTEGNKILNQNPADEWNTVKKQSKKRSLIDAVLTVLAVSDIFIQDQYEKLINRIKTGDIDVPWQEVDEPIQKEEPKNFDPGTFSNGKTSTPETPKETPPKQEIKPPTESEKKEISKTKGEKTKKTPSAKKAAPKKEEAKESKSERRKKVADFIQANKSLYKEIKTFLEGVFPDCSNIDGAYLNHENLRDDRIIPDKDIQTISDVLIGNEFYE